MARTIRLNTTDGSGAAAGSGLTQAQVETIVDDKARWTLAYEKQYERNSIPSGYLPLLSTDVLDQDTASSYHISMIGFGPNSGTAQMDIRFRNGTSAVSGSSRWTGFARYGNNNGWSTNTTFSNGEVKPSIYVNDSVASNEAMNHKEMTFWFGPTNAPGKGRNQVTLEYKHFVPEYGGYQSYGGHSYHSFLIGSNSTANWDNIEFGFGGGAFFAPNDVNPVIQVYKQLRAPAS